MNTPNLPPKGKAALQPFFAHIEPLPQAEQVANMDALIYIIETIQLVDTFDPEARQWFFDQRPAMTPLAWIELVRTAAAYEHWRKQQPLQ